MEDDEMGHVEAWGAKVDAERAVKDAEQKFVNRMIECLYKIEAFKGCTDEDKLYEIADLAVRLAHTCYKQDGDGPVGGYGIKGKFIKAVRTPAVTGDKWKPKPMSYRAHKKKLDQG